MKKGSLGSLIIPTVYGLKIVFNTPGDEKGLHH